MSRPPPARGGSARGRGRRAEIRRPRPQHMRLGSSGGGGGGSEGLRRRRGGGGDRTFAARREDSMKSDMQRGPA